MNNKQKHKISDNPSIVKLKSQLMAGKILSKCILLLNRIGIGKKALTVTAKNFIEIEKDASILDIPDEFNLLFTERGWISFNSMNLDVSKSADHLGQNGGMEEAEKLLADYFNEETIKFFFYQFRTYPPFKSRVHLLENYFIDYREERYHSCVPGVLLILDGIAADTCRKIRA